MTTCADFVSTFQWQYLFYSFSDHLLSVCHLTGTQLDSSVPNSYFTQVQENILFVTLGQAGIHTCSPAELRE